MAWNIHIVGFRERTDPYEFLMTYAATNYIVSIDVRDGIEDLGPAIAAILLAIDAATAPVYSVTTAETVTVTAELSVIHVSYLGTSITVTPLQDGTEQFEVRVGSETALGTRQLAQVDGICAARGRLAAWTYENVIHWSSVVDPMDFTPSIATQANEQRLKALRGKIIKCLPYENGFIIYTTGGILQGSYVGGQTVYSFKSISTDGIIDPRNASNDGDTHLLWLSKGLKLLNAATGQLEDTIPEITDLLHEYVLPVKVQILNGRYATIQLTDNTFERLDNLAIAEGVANTVELGLASGLSTYTENPVEIASSDSIIPPFPVYKTCLVYDMILERWGIASKDYLTLFSVNPINQSGYKMDKSSAGSEPKYHNQLRGLAMIEDTKRASICNDNEPTAYLRFGHFRLSSNGHTQINKVSVEYADYANSSLKVIGSDNGRLLDEASAVTSTALVTAGLDELYLTISKLWYNIIISGKFHLTQLTVEAHKNGS